MAGPKEGAPRGRRAPLAWTLVAVLAALVAALAWLAFHRPPFGRGDVAVHVLDPARVVVLRTPGGHLDVSTLVKVEEFGWRSSRTCLWRDCGWLLGQRVGTIKVPVHYTYRIPLADNWTLRPSGDGYVLSVPAPQPLLPPAIDLEKAQFRSETGGLLAPGSAANQALLLKHLGPELARRAERVDYLQMQAPAAEKTIREFAQQWMREQIQPPAAAVRIEVRMGDGG
ncbi:hypothetical protein [Xenophilus azovorans]|uniref:hypothetical protein n=1 Tax=Xenophilus azovorans TaxID=151755 RepID=UPI00056EFFC7|nr:hypothetical protein [Xenophilus azovorans]